MNLPEPGQWSPDQALSRDRHRLRQQATRLLRENEPGSARWKKWQAEAARSRDEVSRRAALVPPVNYPENLPISEKIPEIREALTTSQVLIIAGETGSGKTTQIPKLCLEMGRGVHGRIGHTQPRRLAASSVSQRLAEEVGCELGEQVGYQVRFTDHSSERTLVKVMTDGILLAETQRDRFLSAYDTLIIDEAHERSLNIDFLLGYLKRILPQRPDLKLIITSATIDVERFSSHFSGAPVIEVSGRTYPVEVRYRPLRREEESDDDLSMQEGVLEALREIENEERGLGQAPGDALVFLVGERDIREMSRFLRDAQLKHTEILPLYARLGSSEQNRIFRSHTGRRVILATNVAETSLTVPGIRYVIDTGEVRISRYSYKSKVQRLPVEPVSQASANQRKGRCGRVAEGICYRLYSEQDFLGRPEFTDPEIQRTNLAAVILQMQLLRLGDISAFPFMQPPATGLINDGYKLLQELQAVDEQRKITPVGRQLARIPLDPRLGRMLIAAQEHKALAEMLVITSGLSIQDPRERPLDKRQAADEKHAQWADEQSDFQMLLNLWQGFEEQREALSQSQLRKYCLKEFLSYRRLREWRETHRQLLLISKELGFGQNAEAASYEAVHKSLLAGLLTQVGQKEEASEYRGPRQRRFLIAPGTRVRKKAPAWVMAAELTETQRLYARMVARIEPEWLEQIGGYLLKSSYLEPHWSRKRGEVCAYEQRSLFGLLVVRRRRVSYGSIDPAVSRELFIREALVEGEVQTRAAFVRHNQRVREEVENLEDKTRRRDLLVSEEQLFDFYDARLPADIHNVRALDAWYRKLDESGRHALILTREDLLTDKVGDVKFEAFPDTLSDRGHEFPLEYQFSPGEKNDGVTLRLPLAGLKQLPVAKLDWLVPGLVPEKIEALLRALPKQWRKQFVPVPEYARALAEAIDPEEGSLLESMTRHLKRMTGLDVPLEAWQPGRLPEHLRLNLQVVDAQGKVIKEGRDYHEIVKELEPALKTVAMPAGAAAFRESGGLTRWPEQPIPRAQAVKDQGIRLEMYPYLRDDRQSVSLVASFDEAFAAHSHRQGAARLILLAQAETTRFILDKLPGKREIGLLYAPVGRVNELLDDFLLAVVYEHFFQDGVPRSREAFADCVQAGLGTWVAQAEQRADTLRKVLKGYHEVSKKLGGKQNLALMMFLGDVKMQVEALVYPGFLRDIPWQWIEEYPRYFEALHIRLEKMPRQMGAERQFQPVLTRLWEQYTRMKEKHQREGVFDPELETYRWMLEELRVSLFAQQLGTRISVSEKKLERQFERVRKT